jgi:hypothetical protein
MDVMATKRLALFLVSAAAIGCAEDPGKRTVPDGIRPEDAVFHYLITNGNESTLVVQLSLANLCEAATVPGGTKYVEISLRPLSEATAAPGTFAVDGKSRAIVLIESDAGCSGSIGEGANRGSITLDSVSALEVRGSFDGVNADTNLDLKGTFVATPCSGTDICL